MFIWGKFPNPEPEGEKPAAEPVPEDDDLFEDRLIAFCDLGFDDLTALALAWNKVSASEVRERWLKRGATHQHVADYYLD